MIREIPDPQAPDNQDGWTLDPHIDVDLKWIKFTLHNKYGQRAYIVIDRQAPAIGR